MLTSCIPQIIKNEDDVVVDLFRSSLFDLHKVSNYSHLLLLIDGIREELGDDRLRCRNGRKLIRLLVINLYSAWVNDPISCVSISRDNNAFVARSRYNKLRVGRSLIPILDLLIEHGYVGQKLGFHDSSSGVGYTTRIWASQKLRTLFEEIKFDPFLVTYHEDQEVIVLRNIEKNDIEYEDTDETIEMRKFVQRYNDFISSYFIDIPVLDCDMKLHLFEEEGPIKVAVTHGPNVTRRIFSRSSFELGGRFYGGWWQNCPKLARPLIFINDQPTSEIDYKNNHIVLLYAHEGLEYPGGDAYDVEQLAELSHISDYRQLVKDLLLMAINAKDSSSTFSAFRSDAKAGSPEKRLTNPQLSLVLQLLREKHSPIAHHLASDAGLWLQRIDSDIAEKIIGRFMDEEIPILIIHDSFVVPDGNETLLEETMEWAFQEVTGMSYVPVEEKTDHPERFMPESLDDIGYNVTEVERAIEWRHNPPRSERYLNMLEAFGGITEGMYGSKIGWTEDDYWESCRGDFDSF